MGAAGVAVPMSLFTVVQPQALTFPHPCGLSVNIYVVGSFPNKGSIFICPWGSFMAALPKEVPSNSRDSMKKGKERVVWRED